LYSYTGNTYGKIICFCGVNTQPGVTMISKSAAEVLDQKGYKVIYIQADMNHNCDYSTADFSNSMEDIALAVSEAKNEREKMNALMHNIYSEEGLHMMPGLKSSYGIREIDKKFLSDSCHILKKVYDYVIMDCGKNISQGLGKYGLTLCDALYIVTTQQSKSVNRIKRMIYEVEEYYPYDRESIRYVINKFNTAPVFPTVNEMSEILGCEKDRITTIDCIPYGWQAEAERKTLIWNRKFMRGIKTLTSDILRGYSNE